MPLDLLWEETSEWLIKAEEDLRVAELLAGEGSFGGPALNPCQQAVEKAIKAFLAYRREVFRKTHSIQELGEQAVRLDASLLETLRDAAPLTEYAWKYRYPGATAGPPSDEVQSGMVQARTVLAEIRRRLPLQP